MTSTSAHQDDTSLALHGAHHLARPTWKLRETVTFYRDIMGLKLVHAISAKGWGPADHPDFLHFFFDSGQGSTIAFFYYIGTSRPPQLEPGDSYLWRATHNAWRVETRDELLGWRERLEARGLAVRQVRHELIESIYTTDPNGYMVEITWQIRPMIAADANDANLTLEAAMALEDQGRLDAIATVWSAKGTMMRARLEAAE
jgi:catechol 2,3-dioxygenase-like lactoylglutathione lyase family enzyme